MNQPEVCKMGSAARLGSICIVSHFAKKSPQRCGFLVYELSEALDDEGRGFIERGNGLILETEEDADIGVGTIVFKVYSQEQFGFS